MNDTRQHHRMVWYEGTGEPERSGANVGLILAMIAGLAALVGLGELAWLALVFILSVWMFVRWESHLGRLAVLLVMIGIFDLHFQGVKLYGSPARYDNRPLLTNPRELVALEAPSTLVCADGTRIVLADTTFATHAESVTTDRLQLSIQHRQEPVLITETGQGSGVFAEIRISYFCGNSYFPGFFPRLLPTYQLWDITKLLEYHGLAIRADSSAQKDR